MTDTKLTAERYLPIRYPEEAPFWDALNEHRLVLQQCGACRNYVYPIGPVCPRCLSDDVRWTELSGAGTVTSYVVFWKGWAPWLEERVPYAVAQVQLAEGPRLTANILGVPASDVHVGMAVEAAYEEVGDGLTILQFTPRVTEGQVAP